jgi:hypothetical protein
MCTRAQAPWGGIKNSGYGRELGTWGLDNFLSVKQVWGEADGGQAGREEKHLGLSPGARGLVEVWHRFQMTLAMRKAPMMYSSIRI